MLKYPENNNDIAECFKGKTIKSVDGVFLRGEIEFAFTDGSKVTITAASFYDSSLLEYCEEDKEQNDGRAEVSREVWQGEL